MNISLTDRLEKLVRGKVESGLYNNASEVIREALRLLLAHDEVHSPAKPDLQQLRAALRDLEKPLRERGIKSLALFGSVRSGTAHANSDVDILVDIASGKRFSLVDLVSVQNFLQQRLGRPVDIVTREGLDPVIRSRVLQEADSVF